MGARWPDWRADQMTMQAKDAFKIEIRKAPEIDLDRNREKWTGTLTLGGVETGVEVIQTVDRFQSYGGHQEILANLLRHAMAEFTRRWRDAATASERLERLEKTVALLERRSAFGVKGSW